MATKPYQPKVSIITVTYQARAHVEPTLLSVLGQTYENKEYLIIDGGSTDGTIELVGQYRRAVSIFVSEPDEGIYDAMNKGLALTAPDSEYVIFMNAGDAFCHDGVLEAILPGRKGEAHLYGDIYHGGRSVRQPAKLGNLYMSTKMICHQSILFSTRLHRRVFYEKAYPISADFKTILEMRARGDRFEKVEQAICRYEGGGISDQKREELFRQRREIIRQYPALWLIYQGKMLLKRCLPFRNQLRMR